jgi:microcystin-dependent protein
MSEAYLGQIEAFPYGFAPKGWQPCQGQLLPINQFQALFSLLGTTYGGNGIQTFALPNLQGRVAMGQGSGGNLTPRNNGDILGEDNHTILIAEMPMHNHALNTAPNGATGSNNDIPGITMVLGDATGTQSGQPITISPYATTPPGPTVAMAASAITPTGGGQPHPNMMPYLGLRFCIAMVGIFPSRA